MRKKLLIICCAVATCVIAHAQRFTDRLDRGLVAVPTGSSGNSSSNLVTWRRLADEYYGVTYNVYKNGTKVASNLTTTCYNDSKSAPITTSYRVAAVVNGVEQELCTAVTPWAQYVYSYSVRCPTGYLDIALATVYDRDGNDVTAHYSPNDAEMADLDGDGQLEIIIKRLNTYDAAATWEGVSKDIYATDSREFVVLDAYDVDWQTGAATLMWRIDCGPNMVSMNSTEIDIIAYDWDEDGKAEVVLRGADNMIVYGSNGQTQLYTIGDMSVNTRSEMTSHSNSQYAWTRTGAEYLIYMNGENGALYQQTDYPLKRLESGETDLNTAWGDSYGHRSTKHFLGAPVLDGRKASLFLARGIYTRHKMIAMDLDRGTHQWSQKWTWNCNDESSPWYGNGYHNFVIADVDEDGRDEIVYGSMVIDDNGRGLSTTGYEHGDAQHVGDFDPYRKGLEFFGCLEDGPYYGSNYRNATTSEVYWKHTGTGDDGRALMGNFSNTYPGSIGRSVGSDMISSVTCSEISEYAGDSYIAWGNLNFRIYWDGDLCSEILNSPGTAKEAKVDKPGTGRLFTSSGCNMNNDTKNNPCFQGDIIGDWREEIVVRCGTNLRVYTSGMGTTYSMPSLWFDHQYRQAMVWQMMAYNQPPHLSYFLGEMEGITMAPPPSTMEGRTEILKDGHITTDYNDQHVLICNNANTSSSFTIDDGAQPAVIFVNTPSWVQGTDVDGTTGTKVQGDGSVGVSNLPEITYKNDYRHNLNGVLTGATIVSKQGDGKLKLSAQTHTYTGQTDIWAGALQCDGTLQSSALWLNRFTTLLSDGGTFGGGITADYAASIKVGGDSEERSSISTTTLTLNHGARLVLDAFSSTTLADQVNAETLTINTKTDDVWVNYGPAYLTPVIEFVQHDGPLANGTYDLGAIETVNGDVSDIAIEGLDNVTETKTLQYVDGHLKLVVGDGISTTCSTPTITESALAATTEGILLPKVDIVNNSFTYEDAATYPTLTASFKDLNDNVTEADIINTLYKEDYEEAEAVTGWTTSGAPMSIATGDATYGNYFLIDQRSTNTRYAYTRLTGVDVTDCLSYNIEFDLAIKSGNTDGTAFCVMSKGGENPSSSWENYAAINNHEKLLFDFTIPKNSTTATINGTETTTTLSSNTWYHYKLEVDRTANTVKWSISNGDSGTFELPAGTSNEIDGFYFVAGRYYSVIKFDNIHVYGTDKYVYTFTEPGTLMVTASHDGCASTTTNHEARFVGTTIGTAGWTSLGCRYPLSLSTATPALEAAYIVSSTTAASAQLTEVSSVPAATGLLLKGAEGTYRIPIATTPSALPADNLLVAVTDAAGHASDGSHYVLAKKTEGVGLYLCKSGVVIPAGKAYLDAAAMAGRTFFLIDADATGISEVQQPTDADATVYSLQGLRVLSPRKGIYIRNGKTVIIK